MVRCLPSSLRPSWCSVRGYLRPGAALRKIDTPLAFAASATTIVVAVILITAESKPDYLEWIFSAAFWTASFTAVLTWSTVKLWGATKRLAEGAEDQSIKMAESIAEMRRSADASEKAIKVTRDVGRARSRAYLVVEKAFMHTHVTPGFPSGIFIRVTNIGESPTKWIEIEANACLIDKAVEALDVPLDATGTARRWTADVTSGMDIPCDPNCGGKKLTDLFEVGLKEQKFLVLQGALRWETVFNEIFESTFFFWGEVRRNEIKKTSTTGYEEVPVDLSRPPVQTSGYKRIDRPERQPK